MSSGLMRVITPGRATPSETLRREMTDRARARRGTLDPEQARFFKRLEEGRVRTPEHLLLAYRGRGEDALTLGPLIAELVGARPARVLSFGEATARETQRQAELDNLQVAYLRAESERRALTSMEEAALAKAIRRTVASLYDLLASLSWRPAA